MMEDKQLQIVEYSSGDKSIENRYHRFNKLLGKGAYKTVYKAFDTMSQVDVAWNCIDLSTLTDNESDKVFQECEMLQKLNHNHILKIRDKWRNRDKEQLVFITDIIQNGSLRKYFSKRKINLKSIKQVCKQILLALDYLHSLNVIHRDLKCDNIFIDSHSNNNRIVLGDLGLSVNFNESASRMSIVGTPHWMAPELYNEKYNELVDIWSFGMCVLELSTNTIPYKECKNTIAVYNKVMIQKKKPDILWKIRDPYIRSFIQICLDFNPSKRPTANELLSHPFLLSRYPRDYILCDKLIFDPNNPNKQKKTKTKHTNNKGKKGDVKVQNVVNKKENITTIKLQIYRKNDKPMAVTFDFNVLIDKPSDVAQEMISELKLPELYRWKVEKAINEAVKSENNYKTQIIGKSQTEITIPTKPKTIKPTIRSSIKTTKLITKSTIKTRTKTKSITTTLNIEIKNDLILNDLSSYLLPGEIEIDEKGQEQIVKKRDELLKEYKDFIVRKTELLNLKIEEITEKEGRNKEITLMKSKISKKKKEIEQQYENFINDYKDMMIAKYTLTQKKVNIAQNFMFENDQQFKNIFNSNILSENDKYEFENKLKDYRQNMADKYLSFYGNLITQYSQQIKKL